MNTALTNTLTNISKSANGHTGHNGIANLLFLEKIGCKRL